MAIHSLTDIAFAGIPLILPDTCILLDILRSPRRDNVDAHSVNSAKTIVESISVTGTVASLIANQVLDEFNDNKDKVRTETEDSLRKLQTELTRINGWSAALGVAGMANMTHGLGALSQCDVLASKWFACSIHEPTTDELTGRAHRRMMQRITPARMGKDSFKDCLVVETHLKVARELRAQNFVAPIVFASSNTAEFVERPGSQLHADIAQEFETLGIVYARTLHEAAFRLGLVVQN